MQLKQTPITLAELQRNMPPKIRLVQLSAQAFDGAVAAARTCYSSKGIVTAAAVGGSPARLERRDRLAKSVYVAGHHTNFQHAQAQFSLEGVSRLFIWSVLHGHPFYNSEQVSQRYVAVDDGSQLIPPIFGKAAAVYRDVTEMATAAYWRIGELLEPYTRSLYLERFRSRGNDPRATKDVRKLCLEAARYVLPLGTTAYLYHTISVLTLFRYWRLAEQRDLPWESRAILGEMVRELLEAEPGYASVLEEPIPLGDTPEATFIAGLQQSGGVDAAAFREEFDASLGGLRSRLIASSSDAEKTLASALRETLGVPSSTLSDEEALALALDPARNRLWGETLNLSTMDRLARPLHHVHFSFRRRLSHAADSQDQRHRMTPASRPSLLSQENGEPDYITPELIAAEPRALACFEETMERIWDGIARFRSAGGSAEDALYLLPNAKTLRFTESADLLSFRHKAAMRLCYNAQEEIWRLTHEEVQQVAERHPGIGAWLLPPCTSRRQAGAKPTCPEGARYCGIPVWRLKLSEFNRVI